MGGVAGVRVGVGVGVGAGGAVGLVRAGAGRAGRARRGSCEEGGGNASSGRGSRAFRGSQALPPRLGIGIQPHCAVCQTTVSK